MYWPGSILRINNLAIHFYSDKFNILHWKYYCSFIFFSHRWESAFTLAVFFSFGHDYFSYILNITFPDTFRLESKFWWWWDLTNMSAKLVARLLVEEFIHVLYIAKCQKWIRNYKVYWFHLVAMKRKFTEQII